MQKLRLIQAGMGGMGQAWWKSVVRNSPDFELVAIVDVAPAPLDQAGDELGIGRERRFASLAAALDAVPADAVLTVTPPAVHVEHAKLAFARGLHLLTEKPIAHDLDSAKLMVRLARDAGRQLLVGQNYRYSAPIQKLKSLFDSGSLGDFGHGHIDFYIPADFTGTFRETMQYPLLVDMSIHHMDLIRFITGRNITRVTAHTFKPSWSWYRHHPGLKMLLELEGGIPFSYSGDWSAKGKPTSWNGTWRLQFAEGALHLEHADIAISRCEKWSKNVTSEPVTVPDIELTGQAALLKRFADAIRANKPAETSGADNLWSFGAVIAGVISTSEGRTVDVAELLKGST